MKNFVEELKWRGMLAQIMPGTEEYLQSHLYTTLSMLLVLIPATQIRPEPTM